MFGKLIINSIGHFILYPLKLVNAVILKSLPWKPGYKFEQGMLTLHNTNIDFAYAIYQHNTLRSLEIIKNDFDGAKVAGLLAYVDPDNYRDLLLEYFNKHGFRRLNSNLAFSRDMDAGFLAGIWQMWHNDYGNKKDILGKAIDKTIKNLKHKGTGNRGYLFKWWFIGDHWLATLAWLRVYYDLFPRKKYLKWLYYYTLIISFPLPFITPESSIFIGRIMGLGWYNAHSRAWNAYLLYKITGNRLYRYALKSIQKKFWFNPEIQALYLLSLPKEKRDIKKIFSIHDWLLNYTDKYEIIPEYWKKWYFNIENFLRDGVIKTWYSKFVLPSEFRRTTYNWSKKMIKNENHGIYATNADYVVLYNLCLKLYKDLS